MSSIWNRLVNAATQLFGIVPVANGGTGLSSGTSGGVLAFTASGTIASSGALTASQVVIGGGAGTAPSALAAGSQYQSLVMGASAPGYSAVPLNQAAAISGTLPVANGGTGVTSSTGSVAVVLSTSPTLVTPVLGVATATSITFGGTALSTYQETTVNSGITWTGVSGNPATYEFNFRQIGKIVTMTFKFTSVTVSGGPTTVNAPAIVPSAMRPSATMWLTTGYMDGTPNGAVTCAISTAGNVIFYKTASAGQFATNDTVRTNSGTDYVSLTWST